MTVLLVRDDREYLLKPGEELQTDLGVLTVPEDVEPGDRLETHLGEAFTVRALRGPDLFHHFERTGAPMMPRDVGLVLGETGISAGEHVLDAGTGTGVLAAYLGRIGAVVTTYESNAEFAKVARDNMLLADVAENVDVRTGDVTETLDSLADGEAFDAITLDTADAPAVVERAPDLLASGASVAVYTPFVEDARTVEQTAQEAGLSAETKETIQRRMDFDDRGSRPQTTGVGHTGYLMIGQLN
ncbi:MAG: methyltransferase domain-containing protein [Halobacteriales archaeon]